MLRIFSGCILTLLMINLVAGKDETPANLVAGKPVPADTSLKKGDRFVGVYDKKNYIVEIRDVKSKKNVTILWVATGEVSEEIDPTTLYYEGDATPTRKSRKSPLPDKYQAFDKNNDGQIALSEWDRAKYADFRKLDKNRDGFLTPQELAGKPTLVAGTAAEAPAKDGESKDSKDLDNPGNLVAYKEKINTTYSFKITGKVGGGVFGTGPYAVESDLAGAAVHAGVLKDGATGTVKVKIVEYADSFGGSSMNGVTSAERADAGPAFAFE